MRFPNVPNMTRHLLALLAQVPAGRVVTCGGLAEALGNSIAARWVGHFTLHHQHSPTCTCHRIVRVGGRLGPYIAGDAAAKTRQLVAEGVEVRDDLIDLLRFGHQPLVSTRPLEKLRRVQEDLAAKVSIVRPRGRPKLVGAVDVAYPDATTGVAAFAAVETTTGKLVWSATIRRRIAFPYITSFLTFRELPILLSLLEKVRGAGRLTDVLLVDGSGIMHPRRAGIASHLGVAADLPTIGVTKKLLCGRVDLAAMEPQESRPVVLDDRLVGVALRPTAGSHRPIFVSPGHRTDVAFAERLVRQLLLGRRLPEPLYWADRLSRTAQP